MIEVAKKVAEMERLICLSSAYPDLQKHVDQWEKVVYYSPSVNSKVDQVEFRYNCCSDSPLEVWPYLETKGGKIYSSPPCFRVGEKHGLGGDKPYPKWADILEKTGISEVVVRAIFDHFRFDRNTRIKSMLLEEIELAT